MARSLLQLQCMAKIGYVTHEKNGVNYITLAPIPRSPALRFKLLDCLFFAGLFAGAVALVLFVAR
jgi:hypothetical protein